jgi:hypothetical protein
VIVGPAVEAAVERDDLEARAGEQVLELGGAC